MELKKYTSLAIVGVAMLVALFVYSTHNNKISPTASALRQNLLAIENGIPTEAGKKDFEKQSNNLTQTVDPELVDLDLPVKEILNRRKRRQRDLIEAPSHAILVDGSGTIFPAPDDVKAQLAKELGKELIEVVRQRHPELERPTEPQRRGRRPNPHPTPAEVRAYLRTLGASVSKAAKHFDLSHREIRRRRDRP